MAEWFESIHEACSKSAWSRGVELARAGAVSPEATEGDEVHLRVVTRGGLVSQAVVLDTDLGDWECDCRGREDPCEHVAAAAIALHRSQGEGRAAAGTRPAPDPAPPPGRLRYQLGRVPGGLALEREIVSGDAVHLLTTTLEAIASGRVDGPRFAATPADIDVERTLGARRRGRMPREAMPRLLRALARCDDVRLDGVAVAVSGERVPPLAVLDEAPGGFVLRVVPDPKIEETFGNGVVLRDGTLCIVRESGLTGREWAELPEGRFYPHDRATELVSEVLPSLESRIRVERRTDRLPETDRLERPRIALRTERSERGLAVLPELVYGDPVRARVVGGRLRHRAGPLPVRDEAAERRLVSQLRDELGLSPGHKEHFEGKAAVEWAERLRRWDGAVEGEAHHAIRRVAPLAPNVDPSAAHFAVSFVSTDDAGSRPADPEAVLGAWSRGESGVLLPDGAWAPLPADWLERFGPVLEELLAARGEDGALPTVALPDLAALCRELELPPPPEVASILPLLDPAGRLPQPALAASLDEWLRPYQRDGVRWLDFLRRAELGALLADDMGLGKTLQTLCVLEGRALVVAPRSLLHNWLDEIERFRPGLRTGLYHGPGRELDPDADITLTSYAILRLDADRLAQTEWDVVVLDEAQAIKNPESLVARAAGGLRARARIALTGTPVENRLDELWSQMHFLNPGLLGTLRDFRDRYAAPIAAGDAAAAERLRRRLRPFVLRRLKRDVAPELPPRTELVLHCELDEEERRVYDALAASTRREVVGRLAAGERGSVMAALEALLRLRQAACHRGLVPGQDAAGSSKVDLLVERLEQAFADGHRALVFSQWTSLLDRVEPALRSRGLPFERLDGATRDRAGVVARFQHEDGAPVLLVSLRAGGAGLNLTAADHVFLLDPWWNPAVEDQAADRAHRIGQERPVLIHRLVAERTVEEGILALQERKRSLAEAALGEADAAASLGREDLLELLG